MLLCLRRGCVKKEKRFGRVLRTKELADDVLAARICFVEGKAGRRSVRQMAHLMKTRRVTDVALGDAGAVRELLEQSMHGVRWFDGRHLALALTMGKWKQQMQAKAESAPVALVVCSHWRQNAFFAPCLKNLCTFVSSIVLLTKDVSASHRLSRELYEQKGVVLFACSSFSARLRRCDVFVNLDETHLGERLECTRMFSMPLYDVHDGDLLGLSREIVRKSGAEIAPWAFEDLSCLEANASFLKLLTAGVGLYIM